MEKLTRRAVFFRKSLINFLCEILAFGKIEAYGILVVFAEWQQSDFIDELFQKVKKKSKSHFEQHKKQKYHMKYCSVAFIWMVTR